MDALLQTILGVPLTTSFFVLTMGASRAMGALFGLWGLYFVLGPAAMLRTIIALVVSAPVILAQANGFVELATETQRFALLLIPLREFVLGFAIGMLVSLPFFSVMGAAMLIDQYRGDFSPGIQSPEGNSIASYASLNVVMVLFVFVEAGGFLLLITVLYQSFQAIPPALPGLSVSPEFGGILGAILQNIMVGLIIFALPVIIILMLLDFAISILARLSEQIKTPSIDFLAKNLALTLIMPILVLGLLRLMQKMFADAPDPMLILMRFRGS